VPEGLLPNNFVNKGEKKMEKQQKRVNVRYLTELALLIALQFVMRMVGLGRVPVGPLYMSFLTVPIAVGAILLGPLAGGVLGAVFGGLSFYDAITGVSVMTGAFFAVDPLNTFVLCVGTRVLVGVCAGWIFRLLHLVDRKARICHWLGALATPVLNTVFFMGYIVMVFYQTEFVQKLVADKGAANPLMFVILLVGVQGLIEAVVCAAVGGAVTKGVSVALGRGEQNKTVKESAEQPKPDELL
jgi:uncharacterized membrane protein